jgi:hypothetical protein
VNGTLEVPVVPGVDEAFLGDTRVRFSPVCEPMSSGDKVWRAMDVTNTGQSALDLTWSDGQLGDVTLDQGGADLYTWSEGMSFTQAVKALSLEPGKGFPAVLNGTLSASAGTHNVNGYVLAMVGPEATAAPLPSVMMPLVVR